MHIFYTITVKPITLSQSMERPPLDSPTVAAVHKRFFVVFGWLSICLHASIFLSNHIFRIKSAITHSGA